MPKNIVVSAHGGRWSAQRRNLTVPRNSRVVFYVPDGGCLSNDDGWRILDSLFSGSEPGGHVVDNCGPGDTTYDYACWYLPAAEVACGIFELGQPLESHDLGSYTAQRPLLLSKILADYPGRVVYWDACRIVSPGGGGQVAAWPDNAYPGPRPN